MFEPLKVLSDPPALCQRTVKGIALNNRECRHHRQRVAPQPPRYPPPPPRALPRSAWSAASACTTAAGSARIRPMTLRSTRAGLRQLHLLCVVLALLCGLVPLWGTSAASLAGTDFVLGHGPRQLTFNSHGALV